VHTRTIGLALIMTVAMVACTGTDERPKVATLGGTPGSSQPTAEDPGDAALRFVECMRDRGVDVVDPGEHEGALVFFSEDNVADPDFEEAQEACRHLLPAGFAPPEMSPQEEARRFDQAVRYTRCMREQGIILPDPEPGELLGLGPGVDPDDPEFLAAERVCIHFLRET
jgi:hypothetical protein